MSIGGPGLDGRSPNERRDVARAKAQRGRSLQKRRERRNRALLRTVIVAAVIAAGVVVAIVLVNSIRPVVPGPLNMADDGIVIGTGLKAETSSALGASATPVQRPTVKGVVAIRVYEDFQCPNCAEFEQTDAAQIEALLRAGKATLQIYPVAVLDRSSQGNRYSSRSANAAACVANFSPDRFYEFHRLLYAHQPPENGDGMTDAQLAGYARQAGATRLNAVRSCIASETFARWVADSTDRFNAGHLPDSNVGKPDKFYGPPVVIVDGKRFTGSYSDAAGFATFILQAGAPYRAGTPSPTPSATPTATASPTKKTKKP